MKVKIKKWAAVATWRWDIPDDDVCGICQTPFDGSCPSCRFPGDDCALRQFPRSCSHLPLDLLTLLQCLENVATISTRSVRSSPSPSHNILTNVSSLALHHSVDQAGFFKRAVSHVSSEYAVFRSFVTGSRVSSLTSLAEFEWQRPAPVQGTPQR